MRKVPKLRFKEFSDEWKEKKLGEILKIFNGYAFSSKDNQNSGAILLKIANVDINKMKQEELSFLPLTYLEKFSKYILKKGDIVIALTRPLLNRQLKIAEIDVFFDNSLLNQRVGKIETNENKKFIYNIFQKNNYIKEIEINISGSDPPNLSTENIKDIILNIPSIQEQEKIAAFLSLVDKKISLTEEKLELFREYKKGVMQKIFSQELRFKDNEGNDYPEWEEKTLNEILIESKQKNTENKYKEVFSVAKFEGVVNQVEHLGRSFASKDISNYKIVNPYDIIYTKSPVSDFPYGIIKQNKLNRTGVVSVLYAVFKPKTSLIGLLLDYYFSLSKNTNNYLYALINKGAKNTININNDTFLKGNLISLPSSVEEQQKIADFLSSIDSKIESIEKELEGLKEFKKGLLQQMFV